MTPIDNDTILALPSWYPSKVDPSNGDFIQRHVQAIATTCKQYVLYIVKDKEGRITEEITEEIIRHENYTEKIVYYNSRKTGFKIIDRLLSHWKYKRTMAKTIDKYIAEYGKPRLVHVHIAAKAGIGALSLKRKFNIPFIVTENWTGYYKESVPNVYSQNPFIRDLNKKVLQEAALLVPVSKDLGKTINENFIKVPFEVIPNVVDTNIFFYKPGVANTFRFIHPSYLSYQKNPEGILAACKILHDENYDFELFFIGNRDEKLMALSDKMGLNKKIVFKDLVPYGQVAIEMQNSSALLLFSRFENLPCVILEALCCGLPVVSSKVGGIAEVIDDGNGILVESENVVQLANAMKKMLDDHISYDREKIAKEAKQKFNYQVVGADYMSIYTEISAQKDKAV